jgi:hypothetical protein
MSVVTACLECRYHGYVSKGSIRIQSNGVCCVTTRTRLVKLQTTDARVPAFKAHITTLILLKCVYDESYTHGFLYSFR